YRSSATVCRALGGDCDVVENCPGDGPACPGNVYMPSSVVCRASAGDCDIVENCPGGGPSCPTDLYLPDTVVCRGSAGDCDFVEKCPGSGPACPGDLFIPAGSPCDDDYFCTIDDECQSDFDCEGTIVADLHHVIAVSSGRYHTCALIDESGTGNGTVKCWGYNSNGQLGNGTTTASSVPVDVTGLASGVTAIASGMYHTCALLDTGGVQCWGNNGYGELGNGLTDDSSVPVNVTGLSSGVQAVDSLYYTTCVIMASSHAVMCWGKNDYGQCGNGNTVTPQRTPVNQAMYYDASGISVGGDHVCVMTGGTFYCWGKNDHGQCGDTTTTSPRLFPVEVRGLTVRYSIHAGNEYTCARVQANGRYVKCWGRNNYGQCGDGTTTTPRTSPVDVIKTDSTTLSTVNGLWAGGYHACVVDTGGAVLCWGFNNNGQVGTGNTTTPQPRAYAVSGLAGAVAEVSPSHYNHTCALLSSGKVQCWGMNSYGQCGNGSTATPVLTPDYVNCN
ncbi:MAG: hypothetical protein KJ956_14780, partial [Actinobacteria bacterium]|nr:hypothetical protein [Actinomycetota bacterium]